jgi:hypothetical protein
MVESKFSRNYIWRCTPPHPAALSSCRRGAQQHELGSSARAGGGAAPTLLPSGTAAGLYRRATRQQGLFYFLFSFSFLKNF